METVVLTWRPANILTVALMVAVVLIVYTAVAKMGHKVATKAVS